MAPSAGYEDLPVGWLRL